MTAAILAPSADHNDPDPEVDGDSGTKRLEAARKAALEIEASFKMGKDAQADAKPKPAGPVHMGVVIHWSGRGFGILRSQSQGEVFVHATSLGNCSELAVGDLVTFEMGFDRRKQKPEAVRCFKAGLGGSQALES